MGTGKPALIPPLTGEFATPDRDVLIAGNATPQAVSAVTAALPWLRTARRFHELEAADDPAQHRAPANSTLRTTCTSTASCRRCTRDRASPTDTGEVLLSFASEVGADLLVMGCFGHRRARDLVLGGASRTVLKSMTLPVLMTH